MSTDRYELVRVDREIAQGLIDDPSAPVVVISLERTADGTADMLLQTPAVTDEMVERGAVALCVAMTGDPSLVDPDDRVHARAVLAAALERTQPVPAPGQKHERDGGAR